MRNTIPIIAFACLGAVFAGSLALDALMRSPGPGEPTHLERHLAPVQGLPNLARNTAGLNWSRARAALEPAPARKIEHLRNVVRIRQSLGASPSQLSRLEAEWMELRDRVRRSFLQPLDLPADDPAIPGADEPTPLFLHGWMIRVAGNLQARGDYEPALRAYDQVVDIYGRRRTNYLALDRALILDALDRPEAMAAECRRGQAAIDDQRRVAAALEADFSKGAGVDRAMIDGNAAFIEILMAFRDLCEGAAIQAQGKAGGERLIGAAMDRLDSALDVPAMEPEPALSYEAEARQLRCWGLALLRDPAALPVCEGVLEAYPEAAAPLANLGYAQAAQGDRDAAQQNLARAAALDPNNLKIRRWLAGIS